MHSVAEKVRKNPEFVEKSLAETSRQKLKRAMLFALAIILTIINSIETVEKKTNIFSTNQMENTE